MTRIWNRIFLCHPFSRHAFVCCLFLVLASGAAHAATAQGRLVNAKGAPAVNVKITLSNEHGRSAPVFSDGNGNYALPNIPAGQYYLEIWVNRSSPQSYAVTITEPSTNLPQEKVK
jgi:hypothetical protein